MSDANATMIVIESLPLCSLPVRMSLLRGKQLVRLIEPFHAYHHRGGMRFFPPDFPPFIQRSMQRKNVSVVDANELGTREIYLLAADKAVADLDDVYALYKRENRDIVDSAVRILNSDTAECIVKKVLCERLAEFHSLHILLGRIAGMLQTESFVFCTRANVVSYREMLRLLVKSGRQVEEYPRIRFSCAAVIGSVLENIAKSIANTVRLSALAMGGAIVELWLPKTLRPKGHHEYVFAITSARQLSNNQRGPDVLVDNDRIRGTDVAYAVQTPSLSDAQRQKLSRLPGSVLHLPGPFMIGSHVSDWSLLALVSLKKVASCRHEDIRASLSGAYNYHRWRRMLMAADIANYISHADFSVAHIGRNCALQQAGVVTWYFTDSMNHGGNFAGSGRSFRHPFWTCLNYDHFVTWDDSLAEYYRSHPGTSFDAHVIGCLWSSHVQARAAARAASSVLGSIPQDVFTVACFDSTFSRNGITSYEEGIAFIKHLLRLLDDLPDVHLILKEKKAPDLHRQLDPEHGPILAALYLRLESHARTTICFHDMDSSMIMSAADMTVSFPFTSTTFEALSANRPACWHDPLGLYHDTAYGRLRGVVTHSYEELRDLVLARKAGRGVASLFPPDSPLMDPFRDGRAIDRFRDLLVNAR